MQNKMEIKDFLNLIKEGFGVSFNYKDVFYTISTIGEKRGKKTYGIGSDNGFAADFDFLESIPDFILDGKTIREIVTQLDEEDIFY